MLGILFQFWRVAADLGIGLGALAAAVAVAVLFAPARTLAIIVAFVIGAALLGYAHGFHEGDLTVRAQWAAANASAAMEKVKIEDAAIKARDDEQQKQIAALMEEKGDLERKVADYEKSSVGGACLVGPRADELRDIAGIKKPAGPSADKNKNPIMRFIRRHRPAAENQP